MLFRSEAAARHLYELGHRRIGFMMGPRNVSTSRDRFAGALRHLDKAGAPPLEEFCVWGSYTHASGYSGALQMLERPEGRPTAIIAGNDTVALGVLEATHRLGPCWCARRDSDRPGASDPHLAPSGRHPRRFARRPRQTDGKTPKEALEAAPPLLEAPGGFSDRIWDKTRFILLASTLSG